MEQKEAIIFDVVNENYRNENLEKINNFFSNDNVPIFVKVPDERLTREEFLVLSKLYENNPQKDIKVVVSHKRKNHKSINKIWELSTIINANKYVNDISNYIKDKKLSPLEALSYIHMRVQKIVPYNGSTNRSWHSNDQFFVGAFMEYPEFVCAGFSSLENEIIKSLNFDNLSSRLFSCQYTRFDDNNKDLESHSRLQIFVDDKKYNIKGHFYTDPTWDMTNKTEPTKFCHFLMSKDCHDNMSQKFDYYYFSIFETSQSGEEYYADYYPEYEFISEQSEPRPQLDLEKIIFNTMCKTSDKSFDRLYGIFETIVNASYEEQIDKKMKGSFNSKYPILSRECAKQIYENYHKINENLEKN